MGGQLFCCSRAPSSEYE